MIQQLVINGVIAGSIYALVALGFGLIYSTTRFFHFAHGAVYTLGAYFTFLLINSCHIPFFLACILSVMIVGIIGSLIEFSIYRPLREKFASPLILLIASLGLYILIQNSISLYFGDDTKSIRTGNITEGYLIFGARITPIQIIILVVSIILLTLTAFILKTTRLGKALRAVSNDPELANIIGISTDKVILYTYFIGSALAGVAAILISLDTDMTPTMGFNALLMGVIAVIIGGMGSISGSACGALLLGLAQNLGVWKIPSQWQDSIAFVILLIFLLIRPRGFFGQKIKKVSV